MKTKEKPKTISIVVDDELLDKISKVQKSMKSCSRSYTIRMLLDEALARRIKK